MLYPLTFHPLLKERVWGGRTLQELYGKTLPPGATIGESWEISDRPGDVSVIANGPLAGSDLHNLATSHASELLGKSGLANGRFPLLIKILDARDKLSLQVHPPAARAAALGGEPKTEMWYIAHAEPGAELYAGLKRGVTRELFEQKLKSGSVAECFHRLSVRAGDALFLPSGRVHAIGGGLVIFEVQQNSDTTYRVYDWGRMGLDGKPRALHIEQSLASIDFNDFEPDLIRASYVAEGNLRVRPLVDDPLFSVTTCELPAAVETHFAAGKVRIIGVLRGSLQIAGGGMSVARSAGQFCLLPAALDVMLRAESDSAFLRVVGGG